MPSPSLSFALFFCIGSLASNHVAAEDITLRIMSYNIHHGVGQDGRTDLTRIATIIRQADADLVALQEVDNRTARSGNVDQAAELARLCEMQGVFGRAINYGGGQYGNAVLSKRPLIASGNHPLPKGGAENRTAVSATIEAGQQKLTFVSTHFDHKDARSRRAAATMVARLGRASKSRVVMAGDLNCEVDAVELRPLAAVFTPVNSEPLLTFPSRAPAKQIDFIYHDQRGEWTIDSVNVIDDQGASDHRPLLAVVTLHP